MCGWYRGAGPLFMSQVSCDTSQHRQTVKIQTKARTGKNTMYCPKIDGRVSQVSKTSQEYYVLPQDGRGECLRYPRHRCVLESLIDWINNSQRETVPRGMQY